MMTYKAPVYRHLASSIAARLNCLANPDQFGEWIEQHKRAACFIGAHCLPSGSGIDNGVAIDFEKSTGEKLIFHTSFHHMNENGYYDGWTRHTITVKASLISGIDIHVSGPNRNDIKEYLHEAFHSALTNVVAFIYDEPTDTYREFHAWQDNT